MRNISDGIFRQVNESQRCLGIFENLEAARLTQIRPERTAARALTSYAPGPAQRGKRRGRDLVVKDSPSKSAKTEKEAEDVGKHIPT